MHIQAGEALIIFKMSAGTNSRGNAKLKYWKSRRSTHYSKCLKVFQGEIPPTPPQTINSQLMTNQAKAGLGEG